MNRRETLCGIAAALIIPSAAVGKIFQRPYVLLGTDSEDHEYGTASWVQVPDDGRYFPLYEANHRVEEMLYANAELHTAMFRWLPVYPDTWAICRKPSRDWQFTTSDALAEEFNVWWFRPDYDWTWMLNVYARLGK